MSLFSEETSYFNKHNVQAAVLEPSMFNVIDFETGYKLDFIVLKSDPFRQLEFSRRLRSEAFGFPVWLVRAEDLILSKLIWIQTLYSDRQIEDIKHLLAIEALDRNYISQWVNRLELNTFKLLSNA